MLKTLFVIYPIVCTVALALGGYWAFNKYRAMVLELDEVRAQAAGIYDPQPLYECPNTGPLIECIYVRAAAEKFREQTEKCQTELSHYKRAFPKFKPQKK